MKTRKIELELSKEEGEEGFGESLVVRRGCCTRNSLSLSLACAAEEGRNETSVERRKSR
jgi:hypothetical protein